MKVAIAPHATADRLADAALLLLDAARSAVAEQEARGCISESHTANVTAIAVQAVMMADHWPAGGMKAGGANVDPKTIIDLVRGAAMGLGLTTAAVPDAHIRAALSLLIGASVAQGLKVGLDARADLKGGAK